MLTTSQAYDRVLGACPTFEADDVPLSGATGRVLRETIIAERDQPPFDRVTMDGIAFRFADLDPNTRCLPVQATQMAGDVAIELARGHCIEIMTGAALPVGADTIVPVERISVDSKGATIDSDYEFAAMRFIHARASDYAAGAHLLTPGKRITPMDIAVIASSGLSHVRVAKSPTIRIISTGNELVAAGAPIKDHQIRLSNGPALQALLTVNQYSNATHHHIVDDVETLRTQISQHLDDADVLVLSGGVSMGKADFVPGVLQELGVECVFHKVSQRPGKPMWFGTGPRGQLVFGLPGNPVSALVCCRRYVISALDRASGRSTVNQEVASLATRISFPPPLTCFQPVRLASSAAGSLLALPVKTNTSGDFRALSETDGFIELALQQDAFEVGTGVMLTRWVSV